MNILMILKQSFDLRGFFNMKDLTFDLYNIAFSPFNAFLTNFEAWLWCFDVFSPFLWTTLPIVGLDIEETWLSQHYLIAKKE